MTLLTKSNLVIQTAFLGDLILAVPLLRRIRKLYPEDKLIVACKQGLGEFLMTELLVDEVFELQKSNSQSYKEVLGRLKDYNIRNIFCLHRSVRSQLFTMQIKAERKIGFSSLFNRLIGCWFFNELVAYSQNNPEVLRQFRILETLDEKTFKEIHAKDFSYLNDSRLPEVPSFFSFQQEGHKNKQHDNRTKIIKIAVFPGSVWATKKWTSTGFSELSQLFIQRGYEVHLLGGPTEKNLCEEIAEKAKGVKVLAGLFSIAETIKQIQGYDLVISNDSAPTHMAAYQNTPVITVFGPTTLNQGFRPWSNQARVVENTSLNCRPCGKHGHQTCPLGHHNCMKLIEAQQVFHHAEELLKRSSSKLITTHNN